MAAKYLSAQNHKGCFWYA